jgi:hypothetical protein
LIDDRRLDGRAGSGLEVMNMHAQDRLQRRWRSRWVFALFGVIALFFLVSEHRAHLLGALPYLLLLACPVLHLFHHHGHRHGHHHENGDRPADAPDPGTPPRDPSSR